MASNNSALDFLQRSYNSNNKSNNLQGSNKGSAGNSSLYEEDEEEKKEKERSNFGKGLERALEGATYLGHRFGLGFIDTVEGTVDYLTSGVAKILETITGNERHKDFYGRVLENDWLNYDAADEWFDPGQGWKFVGDVASGIGQQVYTWGIGALTGGVGLVPAAFFSGAGNAAQEAYKETGKYDADEVKYAAAIGGIEAGLELFLPAGGAKIAKSIGKSLGLSIAKESAKDVVASTGKNLIKKGLKEFFSEGIEEAFTEFITPFVKRETYDEDAEDATAGEIIYAGIVGGFTALFGGGIDTYLKQRSNRKAGKEIEESGSESSVLSLADMLSDIGGEVNKYTKAIQEDIAWLADSFTNKAKENREKVLENREKRQAEREEKRDARKEKRAESFAELRERLLSAKDEIAAKAEENAAKRAEEAEIRKAENEAKAEENRVKSQERIEGINNFIDGLKDKAAENRENVLERREERQAQNEEKKNAALENAKKLKENVNALIKKLEAKVAEGKQNLAESKESFSQMIDSVKEKQRANNEQALADAKKLGETLSRLINKIEAKAKAAAEQKINEVVEKTTEHLDNAKENASENQSKVKDILDSGKELVNNGIEALADVADSIKNKVKNAKPNNKDANAKTRDNILKIVEALEGGAKLNWAQKRILGEIRNFETSAIFEPIVKRSALTVIESAEAVANKLNLDGVYKMVDGKLANVREKGFETNGKEVRDITADDIRSGINLESNASLKENITDALKNNEVLRFVAASDAAGRLMMNAKQTEQAAANGSKIKTKEEFTKFLSESSKEEKNALAKELGVDDLDSITFGQFKDVVNKYINSGKAAKLQEKIKINEQLNRMKMSKAEKMPKEINLEDGQMKHYSDANNDIAVVRKGNKYIVHDFTNNTYSNPISKSRLDTLLGKKRAINSTSKSDEKALSMYEAKLQADYDKDAPLREARARIREQMMARSLREKSGALATSTPEGMPRSKTTAETESTTNANSSVAIETKTEPKLEGASKIAAAAVAMRNAENIVKEKVSDYDQMDDAKKAKILNIFKSAIKSGISAKDATSYARVAARTGLDIVFDKEACRSGNTYYAGYYDPDNNRIVVNPETTKSHASLLIHELSHAIRSYRGKDNKIHYLADKNAKISPDLWQKVKKYYADQNVNVNRMDLYLDEASAYYAEEILGTDAALDLLLGKKKTLKEKILSFFKGAIKDYAGDEGLTREARKFYRSFKKMFDAFEAKNQMAQANVQKEDADKADGRRYSFSSIAYSFFGDENMSSTEFSSRNYKDSQGYKNYVEKCIANMKQSHKGMTESAIRKEVEASIDGIVKVALAMKRAGYDIHDTNTKRGAKDTKNRLLFSSLEPNSDYFTSSDISTICDKRKNFAEIYDDIVREEEKLGVPEGKRFFNNVDNYFYIHDVLAKKGLTQPCRECYVESMRKNLAPMANAFLELIRETDEGNVKNKQLYDKGKLKSGNAEKRTKVLELLNEYGKTAKDITIEMLSTEDGLAQMKLQMPELYEIFNSFYGQSKPKMPKGATPFRFGELTALLTDEHGKIKTNLVEQIESTGGFRLQSYSDFQIQNYTDVLQVIFEAGTLGLTGHAYTKVPAFLDATKGTNLKRNISVFMYKDGSNWRVDRNDSFPYSLHEMYKLVKDDKRGNTGIIVVSQNADNSAWIMANDLIAYGIPFHKSGLKMGVVRDTIVHEDGREIAGYKNIKDHTKQQSEVYAKTEGDHKALTKVKKGINIYEFWDFENKSGLSKNELIKKNLKEYINRCEEAGYLPKFREYVMNNKDVLNAALEYAKELGSVASNATINDISFNYKGYQIPYGYYKFLGDFSMFNADGKASPHDVLSLAKYDFDEAVNYFSNAEQLRRKEILQQFANGKERTEYAESALNSEELSNIVDGKRKEVVNEIVYKTNPERSANIRAAMELDNSVNLQYNENKTSIGGNIDEQAAENSGVLVHGRKTSAVGGSKNDQRKQGYDTSAYSTQVEGDGIVGGRHDSKSGHAGNVTSWLSRERFVSQTSFNRFRETILRDRSGLNQTDINGKEVPANILQAFKDTVLTDENGSLLVLYHWTANKFKVFARGDIGFHFGGTYVAAYDRRESKHESQRGADLVKEVYANIKNPILLDDPRTDWDAFEIADQLWTRGLITLDHKAKINRMSGANFGGYDAPASVYVRKLLDKLGYDGIIYENGVEDKGALSVIALYPDQIYTVAESKVQPSDSRRFSIDDSYLSAVERGDMETAQRMVDEAAISAGAMTLKDGVTKHYYHGTNAKFTSFEAEKARDGTYGFGFYFSPMRSKAGQYGDIKDVYLMTNQIGTRNSQRITADQVNAFVKKYNIDMNDSILKYADSVEDWIAYKGDDMSIMLDLERLVTRNYDVDIKTLLADLRKTFDYDGIRQTNETVLWDNRLIKSADPVTYDDNGKVIPLSKRFDTKNPDIRYAVEESTESPTIGNVAKSRFDAPKPKMKEKIKAGFTSAKDKLYIEGVDELYGVEKYLKKFGGRKDAEAFVQQVRASETIAQTMIGLSQYDIMSGDGTRLGDGISKIFKPYKIRKIEDQFNDYLLHQLNVDRMTLRQRSNGELDNKPVFGKNEKRDHDITAAESKKIIAAYEKKYSSFKADAEKVWSYSKNLLNMRVKAGLISQEAADLMNRYYPHYVPSFRVDAKSVGASAVKNDSQLGVNSTIKKAKGGSSDIYSIEESIAAQTRQAIKAMEINKMANAVYDAAIKSGDTSYVIAEEVETEKNTDPDKDIDVDLIPKNNQIVFFKDGKRIEMNVSKEIFDGFKGVTSGSVPDMFITRMANRGVNAFKNLVTSYSPAFSVRNFVRDIQDALINSKHVTLFGKNIVAAMKGIASNDALWQQYLAHGGYASTVFDGKGFTNGVGGRGFEALQKISEIDGKNFKKLSAAMKNILVSVGNANAFVEQVTRFAEFRASIEAGDSIQTAINNSADVTTNFSRHGKSVKVLNATFIPFLNASVQGFDKLLRVITGPFKEKSLAAIAILLAKALAIGIAPQILNMIMNGDDEEYYDLTDEVRENYFLIKVGDQYLKIPRGRAAAAFGGVANRIGNEMRGDDFDVGGYLTSLKDNVTPVDSFSRNILSPFKDIATNTTWYGGEIEGRQFDNVRPSQRYDESTSSIAIAIAHMHPEAWGVSPKKVHYLLDQYSGVIGDFLLPATTKKAEKDYLSANFLIDSSTNNKLSNDFYKLYDEAMYATEEGDMIAYYQLRHLNDVKESVSKLYEQINEIQNSDFKNAEKLQQVRTLRVLINNIYRTATVDYAAYKKAIEATDGMFDDSDDSGKRDRHVAITQMMYGSEKALEEYNKGVYEKSALFNKAGISYDTFYEYYFGVRDLESDVDKNGEVVEGSKKKKVEAAVKSMGVDSRTRALLLMASGYSVTDSEKRSIASYIRSLDLTEEEFEELAKACGFKVKNGRIQL